MKILLAVDDSPFTRQMLAWLATHEEWLAPQHTYTVVHAQLPLPNGLRPLLTDSEIAGRMKLESDEVFKPVRAFLERHGFQPSYLAREGAAAPVIAEEAERQGVDVIVMGSHGHSAAAQWLLGSVVSKVLALSPVPVLVVKRPPTHGN